MAVFKLVGHGRLDKLVYDTETPVSYPATDDVPRWENGSGIRDLAILQPEQLTGLEPLIRLLPYTRSCMTNPFQPSQIDLM